MAFNKAKALQQAQSLLNEGKVSLAIKQYLLIIENEPAEFVLLNTIGDLYIRERNIPEALRQFHKLAETYTREGFTVRAIAIFKKIAKLDPSRIEPLLKLAELYALQGLSREAREQYVHAFDYYRKKNQNDKALEVLRKMVQLDPENVTLRSRLADFCEHAGRKSDAAQVYLEAAQAALRAGNATSADHALKKAAGLDPKNPQVRLLKARLALASKRPEEVEKIIAADPQLKSQPAARELLLEAYLAARKLEAAGRLVVEVYRASPGDFSPLKSFSDLCIEKGEFDAALKPLEEVAVSLIEQKNTAPLVEVLRQIWDKNAESLPALELLYTVYERTGDSNPIPEVLEGLGNAYVKAGQYGKAEDTFKKLVERDPGNDHFKDLLKQVLQKGGKEAVPPSPAEFSSDEVAFAPTLEQALEPELPPPSPPPTDPAEAALVSEALENSDLFARYGLIDKALAELDKALAVYPDQMQLHERALDLCQRTKPERAAAAADALVRILAARGDTENARRYEALAGRSPRPPEATVESQGAPTQEFVLSPEVREEAPAEASALQAAPPPAEEPAEAPAATLTTQPEAVEMPQSEAQEVDLSTEFEALSTPSQGTTVDEETPPYNDEEARIEVNFYLEQGFEEEARKTVQGYEEKFPGNPQVAELGRYVADYLAAARESQKFAGASPASTAEEPAAAEPAPEVPPPPPQVVPKRPPKAPTPARARVPQAPARVTEAPPAATRVDLIGDLARDLAPSLDGIEEAAPPPPKAAAKVKLREKKLAGPADPNATLSGLLEELSGPEEAAEAEEDPETHYNLGVAFREMGLFDEAIGEFQKVVRNKKKGKFPPHFLQACTLLAATFMDKKMPAIAVKWYSRALEMPDLDDEATLALHYDLGVAYEEAGEAKIALEKFTEVYSQNIDYRDVAEKIRQLQQKSS